MRDMVHTGDLIRQELEKVFGPISGDTRQVFALAEEVGEFVGAYRRVVGMARRTGSWEDVESELADVIITAYVTAAQLNIDIDAAIERKLSVIFTRGWKDAD